MTGPDPRPERAILGAMLTGALTLGDLNATLSESFHYAAHRSLYLAFYSALEARRGRGIPLAFVVALCDRLAAPGPLGAGVVELRGLGSGWCDDRGRARWIGYVPTLAREAPRRKEALAALDEVRGREVRAWDLERDREAVRVAVLEAAQTAALAFLRVIEGGGGLPYVAGYEAAPGGTVRRYAVRPVDREALPSPREVMQWIGGAA